MLQLGIGPPDLTRATPTSPAEGAIATAVAMAWPGVVLPPTRIGGRCVHPVVEFLPAAQDRLTAGIGPELDRSTLAMWESWPCDLGGAPPPGPALRIVGFVIGGSWQAAVTRAARLAGYGASLLIRRATPTRLRLAEADYRGMTIVVVDERGESRVVVGGGWGPAPCAERTVATRLHEERLFAVALGQGCL